MRAAKEIPKHGFRLIVRVMSQKNFPAAVFHSTMGKEYMPRVAGGGFHRFPMLFHPLADVGPAKFTGQTEFCRQPFYE
jgi:hypothetical protein